MSCFIYLIPFFGVSGGLLLLLLSFDVVPDELRVKQFGMADEIWMGVNGKCLPLSGLHRRVTSTVAGCGIEDFEYGTGICL